MSERSVEPFVKDDLKKLEDKLDSGVIDYDTFESSKTNIMRNYAKKRYKLMRSAIEKAPRLDEPIQVYRGTNVAELTELLGEKTPENQEELDSLKQKLLSGNMNNATCQDSRITARIPKSGSIFPDIAHRFAQDEKFYEENIILSFSQKTCASPVNVSAWSAGEGEVFVDGKSKFKLKGARIVERESRIKDQPIRYFYVALEEV